MAAKEADFSATAPWKGIIGKPQGTADQLVLVWDDAKKDWTPVTLAQLKAMLASA